MVTLHIFDGSDDLMNQEYSVKDIRALYDAGLAIDAMKGGLLLGDQHGNLNKPELNGEGILVLERRG